MAKNDKGQAKGDAVVKEVPVVSKRHGVKAKANWNILKENHVHKASDKTIKHSKSAIERHHH